MTSPLKRVRIKFGQTLRDVSKAVNTDTGNLSRIERGLQVPSRKLVEKLSQHFDGQISEIEILFPDRFTANESDK